MLADLAEQAHSLPRSRGKLQKGIFYALDLQERMRLRRLAWVDMCCKCRNGRELRGFWSQPRVWHAVCNYAWQVSWHPCLGFRADEM